MEAQPAAADSTCSTSTVIVFAALPSAGLLAAAVRPARPPTGSGKLAQHAKHSRCVAAGFRYLEGWWSLPCCYGSVGGPWPKRIANACKLLPMPIALHLVTTAW